MGEQRAREALEEVPELRRYLLDAVQRTGKKLGTGSYGSVDEVAVDGVICAAKLIHEVLLDVTSDPGGIQIATSKYVAECQLMSDLRHPHIVQFLGICFLEGSSLPALVMEKLVASLDDVLENTPNIPLGMKKSFLTDTIKGLLYLHNHTPTPIIHRDLSARNILLNSAMVAKISDLGNSRMVHFEPGQLARTLSRLPGTLCYMPPEALDETALTRYGPSLDIFSFGHTTLFTLTQVFPGDLLRPTYPDPDNRRHIIGRSEVERRQPYLSRLYQQLSTEHPLVQLVKRCLDDTPGDRPSTMEVLQQLEAVEIEDPYQHLTKLDMVQLLQQQTGPQRDEQVQRLHAQLQQMQLDVAESRTQRDRAERERERVVQEKDEVILGKEVVIQRLQLDVAASRTQRDRAIEEKVVIIRDTNIALQRLQENVSEKDRALQEKDQEKERAVQDKERAVQDEERALQEKERAVQDKERAVQEKKRAVQEKERAVQEKERAVQEKERAVREKFRAVQEKDGVIWQKERVIEDNEKLIQTMLQEARQKDDLIRQKDGLLRQRVSTLQKGRPAAKLVAPPKEEGSQRSWKGRVRRGLFGTEPKKEVRQKDDLLRQRVPTPQEEQPANATSLTLPKVTTLHRHTKIQFQQLKQLPTPMRDAQAVIYKEALYVGGGSTPTNGGGHALCVYNFQQDTWDAVKTPTRHYALAVYQGHLVLAGGLFPDGTVTNKLWVTDQHHTFQNILPMNTATFAAIAIATETHLIVAGGDNGGYLDTVQVYDGQQWTLVQSLPVPASEMKYVCHNDIIYLMGAINQDKKVFYASLSSLLQSAHQPKAIATQTAPTTIWNTLTDAPSVYSSIAVLRSELVSVGGYPSHSSSLHTYSQQTHTWDKMNATLPQPLTFTCSITLPTGELMVIGGRVTGGQRSPHVYKGTLTE